MHVVAVICATHESRELLGTTSFSSFIVNKESEQHRDKLDFGCYLSPTAVSGNNLLSCDVPVDFSISERLRKQIEISRYIDSAGIGHRAEHGPKL